MFYSPWFLLLLLLLPVVGWWLFGRGRKSAIRDSMKKQNLERSEVMGRQYKL